MKIVIAMDSFKGSLSALEACQAAERGIRQQLPAAEIVLCPLADGGEGTVKTLVTATGGEWIEREVTGPLPDQRVRAGFGLLPGSKVLVEMAKASGLELLRPDELDPLKTTTFGTGELLRAGLETTPEKLWMAVGGSATVDGGVGVAMALGWKFYDRQGVEVGLGGAEVGRIHSIEVPDELSLPPFEVLCDVENPFIGPKGAARVFGPQKGADAEMVEILEANLSSLADVIERQLGVALHEMAGAGAAGGLAGGAVAFLGAQLVSGIEVVMEATGLPQHLAEADWVVTGEGRFDSQSLDGKVVAGVLRLAERSRTGVGVLAGSITVAAGELERHRISAAQASKPSEMDLAQALAEAPSLLEAAASRLARSL